MTSLAASQETRSIGSEASGSEAAGSDTGGCRQGGRGGVAAAIGCTSWIGSALAELAEAPCSCKIKLEQETNNNFKLGGFSSSGETSFKYV